MSGTVDERRPCSISSSCIIPLRSLSSDPTRVCCDNCGLVRYVEVRSWRINVGLLDDVEVILFVVGPLAEFILICRKTDCFPLGVVAISISIANVHSSKSDRIVLPITQYRIVRLRRMS
uniref:LITAF domain-containing protein n=1 Tax=Glossina palpalis gambiensis TaxID=67801 RepID=A0A1B0BRZ4_9MUSC